MPDVGEDGGKSSPGLGPRGTATAKAGSKELPWEYNLQQVTTDGSFMEIKKLPKKWSRMGRPQEHPAFHAPHMPWSSSVPVEKEVQCLSPGGPSPI